MGGNFEDVSMVGDELIGRMRDRQPDLKVLLLTSHGDILARDAPSWWEPDAHIPKPLEIQALRLRVAT